MQLTVIDRVGVEHVIENPADGSLMEALRELDYGVAAICGGMCLCATCHVYIRGDWVARLASLQRDEAELLADLQHHRENSRLACQIQLSSQLDGLCVTLAPEE